MFLAICQVYIEQVNLAIAGNNFSITIDQYRGVVKLSCELRIAFDDTSTMDNHFMPARFLLQEFYNGPWDGLCCSIKAGIRPKICPEFGEANELCAHLSSLIQKSLYVGQILSRIITRVHLNDYRS